MQYIYSIAGGYILALLSLILFYKKLQPKWLQLFLWFILFEFIMQITAVISLTKLGTSSAIANTHTIVAHVFYQYIFYLSIEGSTLKKLPLIFIVIFLVTGMYEIFYLRSVNVYANITDVAGRIFILVCSLLYLRQLLTKDEVVNYFKNPMFWITTGILVCIAGDWVYVLFYNYLIGKSIDDHGEINYPILIITNNLQFILFTIGFVCNVSWKKMK